MRKVLVLMLFVASLATVGFSEGPVAESRPLGFVVENIPAGGSASGLYSMDPIRRALACQRLAEQNDTQSLAELLRLADDEDPMVQAHAICALGSKDTPEAVNVLLRTIRRGNWRARRCAVEALGRLSTPQAVAALEEAANDDSEWVRIEAFRALAAQNIGRGD